jgi:hypothetical protein
MYFWESYIWPVQREGFWTTLLIAILLLIIPIVNIIGGFILYGYWLRMMLSVRDEAPAMPDFEWVDDLIHGALAALGAFIYSIAGIAFFTLAGLLLMSENLAFFGIVMLALGFVALVFVTLFLPLAYAEYARTWEFGAFFRFGRYVNLITARLPEAGLFILNALLYGIVVSVLVSIGTLLLIVPGIIAGYVGIFGSYVLQARYAQRMGVL